MVPQLETAEVPLALITFDAPLAVPQWCRSGGLRRRPQEGFALTAQDVVPQWCRSQGCGDTSTATAATSTLPSRNSAAAVGYGDTPNMHTLQRWTEQLQWCRNCDLRIR